MELINILRRWLKTPLVSHPRYVPITHLFLGRVCDSCDTKIAPVEPDQCKPSLGIISKANASRPFPLVCLRCFLQISFFLFLPWQCCDGDNWKELGTKISFCCIKPLIQRREIAHKKRCCKKLAAFMGWRPDWGDQPTTDGWEPGGWPFTCLLINNSSQLPTDR